MIARIFVALSLLMCVVVSATTDSIAWEFRLNGLMEYKYEYYSQNGTRGFFGPYDVDKEFGALRDKSSNAWLGIETWATLFHGKHPGVVTGSDAAHASLKIELLPEIRITPALRLFGKYRIDSNNSSNADMYDYDWPEIGPGLNSQYLIGLIPGRNNAMGFGEWTMFWMSARTPWGTVSIGKKPFEKGCGLLFNAEDATEQSILLEVPYGPIRVGIGFYPMTLGQVDFFDLMRRNQEIYEELGEEILDYYGDTPGWDKSGQPNKGLAYVEADYADMSLGLGAQYTQLHFGSEGRPIDHGFEWPTIDQTDLEGWAFVKYNNGRFFFNSEVDFLNRKRQITKTRDRNGDIEGETDPRDGGGSIYAPTYVDAWQWMVEGGIVAGRSKLSLLYAFIPGPDRRHGVLIDKQPTTFPIGSYVDLTNPPAPMQAGNLNRHVGNSGVFRPYSLLLGYEYGAGLNCYDLNGNGTMTDASVFALRLDYALAANLNVFTSFMKADRASHGWQWGTIYPLFKTVYFAFRPSNTNRANEFLQPIPTIPDTDLGWESDFGVQWELLSNLQLKATVAYWQPGAWFTYACRDRRIQDWDRHYRADFYGTAPLKIIDPIVGMEMVVQASF